MAGIQGVVAQRVSEGGGVVRMESFFLFFPFRFFFMIGGCTLRLYSIVAVFSSLVSKRFKKSFCCIYTIVMPRSQMIGEM